jgi:hypothetical protein
MANVATATMDKPARKIKYEIRDGSFRTAE